MTFRDFVEVSTGNLWRMKLRTFLTISGVVIAIAAFVSMLSFGAGNQKYVKEQFDKLGLFSTMQVYPKTNSEKGDTIKAATLDKDAIQKFANLPGVNLAYPYESFSATVKIGDSITSIKAQALPATATRTKLFSRILAGKAFESDSSRQVLLSEELTKPLGITALDSLIGKSLILSVKVSSLDSGLVSVFGNRGEKIRERFRHISFDSLLFHSAYRKKTIVHEANDAIKRFMDGYLNARKELSDTLIICGVLEERHAGRLRSGSVILPAVTASQFTRSGFSGDPTELFSALNSGTLFTVDEGEPNKSYPVVTLDLDPHALYKPIRDSVEAMGFRAFSFAEQFDEIRRAFLYFDMALGVIGLIALITASLGIINTMVMSILERKREIGVLKSLGADDREIRFLFLAESGMIGIIGAAAGILFGWCITRIASAVAKMIMTREGVPVMELFALPWWLIGIALAIGIVVSLLAGLYPAARASRVDPVEALRND